MGAAFAVWTWIVCTVDVQPIGPNGSSVGLSMVNGWFHAVTGVHLTLYTVTDWLGLVPVAVAVGFAIAGLVQWIRYKSLWRVDADLFVLGGCYLLIIAGYLLFEEVVINYRPLLIEGRLEASYPSSTTLLTLCVMGTAWRQAAAHMKSRIARRVVTMLIAVFTVFMVAGRLWSGVHWLSDIIGGVLLSATLLMLYCAACACLPQR